MPPPAVYHARMNGGLLNVAGNASDESISVLEVGIEVGLWEDGKSWLHSMTLA